MSLTEMRKNSGSLVTYLLFAMIIIVFVFTFNTIGPAEACGGAQGPGGPNAELAEVGDVTIDTNKLALAEALIISPASPRSRSSQAMQRNFFYRATRYYFTPMRRSAFSDFGVEAFDFTPIKVEKAMNTLIETLLVSEEAKKMGLSVSNGELKERLSGTETFVDPKTGSFSSKMWEEWVRRVRTTPTRMEEFLKQELLREKLVALVVSGVTVSDDEMLFHHRATKEKVNVEYVEIDEDTASPLLAVADADVKTWLQANQDKVKKYYDDNKSKYDKAERVVFRGIQFRAPNRTIIAREKDDKNRKTMQSARDAARKKAVAALAELNKKAGDAAKAATPTEENKPADAKKDGAKKGDDKKAADAKKGDDKKAADAKKGDKKAADKKDGAKKSDDKKAADKKDGAKKGDDKKAADAKKGDDKKAADAKKDDDKKAADAKKAAEAPKKPATPVITEDIFASVAKDQSDHESKVKGGLFDKGYDKTQLSRYPFGAEMAAQAFSLKVGGTSGIIEVNDGFWIIHKVKALAAEKKELAEVQTEIAKRLYRKEKVGAFVETLANDVLAEAKKDPKKKLSEVLAAVNTKYKAGDEGLDSEETGMFPRVNFFGGTAGSIPKIGMNEELSAASFAASKDKPLLDKVFTDKDKKKRFVARFIDREDAGEMKAEDMKDNKQQLLEQRQRSYYAAWLKNLVTKARADGRVTETNDWATLVTDQRRQFVEGGGSLGGEAKPGAPGVPVPVPAGQ